MKRQKLSVLPLLGALLLLGCVPLRAEHILPTPKPTATATAEPTPKPTPAPIIVLSAPESAEAFRDALSNSRLPVRSADSIENAEEVLKDGASAIIVYQTGADGEAEAIERMAASDLPVVVFAAGDGELPEGVIAVRIEAGAVAAEALDYAIAYPPHDTPVRLLGMFTDEQSDAAKAWNEAVASGRVMDKGVHFAAAEKADANAWMTAQLARFFPGMLDGIYAETASDAVIAANALIAAERDDVEIFCAGSSEELLALMKAHGRIVALAYGADEAEAGKVCLELVENALSGEAVKIKSLPIQPITPTP